MTAASPRFSLTSAADFFELVGRVIMDFGFSGVIDKFEEYWGKRWTKRLLMLIGLGISAICVGAIWQWLLSPLLAFFQTPLWGRTITQLVLTAVAIGGGVAVGLMLVTAFGGWRYNRKLRSLVSQADTIMDRASASYEKSGATLADSRTTLNQAVGLLEGIAMVLREQMAVVPPDQQEDYRIRLEEAERIIAKAKEPPEDV